AADRARHLSRGRHAAPRAGARAREEEHLGTRDPAGRDPDGPGPVQAAGGLLSWHGHEHAAPLGPGAAERSAVRAVHGVLPLARHQSGARSCALLPNICLLRSHHLRAPLPVPRLLSRAGQVDDGTLIRPALWACAYTDWSRVRHLVALSFGAGAGNDSP